MKLTVKEIREIIDGSGERCCAELYCERCNKVRKHMAYKVMEVSTKTLDFEHFCQFLAMLGVDAVRLVGDVTKTQVYVIFCQVCVHHKLVSRKDGELTPRICGQFNVGVVHKDDWKALVVELSIDELWSVNIKGNDDDELWDSDNWFI